MEIAGREWLWQNERVPHRLPLDGTSYMETADSGGYDECFPTVAACHVPADVPVYGGLALPDHGELWAVRPSIEVSTPDAGGTMARTTWTGRRMPYRFTRTVQVTPDGAVEMRYSARNEGPSRLPFIWAAQVLLPLTRDTRIGLPAGAAVRVGAEHGIDLGGAGAVHQWPEVKVRNRVASLAVPDAVAKRYAVKLFAALDEGRVTVEQDAARLELSFDPRQVPDFGLWINRRGWSGVPRRAAPMTVGLGPAIGAPDSLADALGSWNRAHWLEAGETREWALAWRGLA